MGCNTYKNTVVYSNTYYIYIKQLFPVCACTALVQIPVKVYDSIYIGTPTWEHTEETHGQCLCSKNKTQKPSVQKQIKYRTSDTTNKVIHESWVVSWIRFGNQ